ncbi:helix-turn-helix domain-containing protein [Lactobacillus sp. S2-2]|uniref:helix-turn-helix domain-containing protein n=1 Tax=Lactobacillus sp. S2-2 TaxID=2692917 RepID=UPI001F3CBC17|nr:helix-turn-helix transcriptional regulator [Lactobacillus sp. S2-2]MCF6515592.1 helix-turn-helix domain-containing protein [Lactobacillus sp. S2-2]
MILAEQLKNKREEKGLSQNELANRLHLTRQTISRWETGKTVPNLDTLVQLSDELNISLDQLLRDDDLETVTHISRDVKKKKWYKIILLLIIIIALIFWVMMGVFSWGRYAQNDMVNRANPFMKYQYDYALLPKKTPMKKVKEEVVDMHGKSKMQTVDQPQPVDAFVVHDAFGNGEWIKFQIGEIPKEQDNYALVMHKGSYVKEARLINRNEIPANIRYVIGNKNSYQSFDSSLESQDKNYIKKNKQKLRFNQIQHYDDSNLMKISK